MSDNTKTPLYVPTAPVADGAVGVGNIHPFTSGEVLMFHHKYIKVYEGSKVV